MKRIATKERYTSYPRQLRAAIAAHLPARGLPLCSADQRVRWSDRLLVIAALLVVWSPAAHLQEALAQARETLIAMYPTRRRPGVELSGFLRALQARSAGLLTRVTATLRVRLQRLAGTHWRWRRWVVLGVDGSRLNCPRTRANEQAFGCAGRRRTAPQQLLLTLFHVATGLPWAWRRDRGDAGERVLLRALLDTLPPDTLLLADAGFTGYDLLSELQRRGHAFIVRAGRHVRLLRKLGYAVHERRGIVYLWPDQQQERRPPLTLRLVTVRPRGHQPVALLTNVLDEEVLSGAEIALLYRQRWGIEVLYRALKQTLGKRTLRAETPRLAECELDWAMTGLWLLGLLTLAETGVPRGWSPAAALRVVRQTLRNRRRVGRRRLRVLLRAAGRDVYLRTRPKTARDWPHKKNEPPPGEPNIRMATPAEIAAAQRFSKNNHAA